MKLSNETYFSLNFMARKSRPNKEGEIPVLLRITMNGQRTEMYTNRYVKPENWNASKGQSKGKSKKDQELNRYLDTIRTKICEIHNQLVRQDEMITPEVLKRAFLGKLEKPMMLCEGFRTVTKKMREKFERGDIVEATVLRWERCVKYLEEFLLLNQNEKDVPMKKLSPAMVDDFEHFLRVRKQCANNAAVKYIRYLKNVVRVGLANKWIEDDPFLGKRYTRTKTEREHLTEAELHRIMGLDLRMFPRLDLVRDTFVFCCFCGLAFIDISTLTRDQIITDNDGEMWIRKNRQKTGEVSTIPLLDIPKKIAEKYRNHPKAVEKNVVIPVISNQRMNSYLDEIAAKAEVKKHLTTHIARHTFATVSLNNHVPIETISKMLGHADIATTQIYARMLYKTVSEDMERMRAKFDTIPVEIKPLPELPTTFVPEPTPKRGRPRKFQ